MSLGVLSGHSEPPTAALLLYSNVGGHGFVFYVAIQVFLFPFSGICVSIKISPLFLMSLISVLNRQCAGAFYVTDSENPEKKNPNVRLLISNLQFCQLK